MAILQARTAGLLIMAVSMGVLFGILLLVINRADGIITTRTTELAVAYENLRQAESMRDDLTNMIVHDLRSPLSTIYGSLGLARHINGEELSEANTHYIDQALRASERMTGLIDDILTVSKIEAGQFEPRIEFASVTQLLSDRLGAFADQAAEENKQLMLNCPTELNVPVDYNMIGRVVDNLVSNAIKYTDDGGQIQVSAWTNDEQLFVRVRDDGEGIPDDYKQRIFEKFAQAPNAAENPNRTGTGLGLTFCERVVQLHHGRIWVEDAPGGGSDFIVRLPLHQDTPLIVASQT
jgi:signal transduction histidine kinase